MLESEIAFCSTKIFNSEVNIFKFLEENAYEKDRLFSNLRKNLFVLIGEYISYHKKHVFEYLPQIKEKTLKLFKKDISNFVKPCCLGVLCEILKNFPPEKIKDFMDPESLIDTLLD